jgi:hypothetical protein
MPDRIDSNHNNTPLNNNLPLVRARSTIHNAFADPPVNGLSKSNPFTVAKAPVSHSKGSKVNGTVSLVGESENNTTHRDDTPARTQK